METIGLLVTREPATPQNIPATPCWTPGTDAASPPTPLVTNTVREWKPSASSSPVSLQLLRIFPLLRAGLQEQTPRLLQRP